MNQDGHSVFDSAIWRPALEKFGAATQLTVWLFDTHERLVCGPFPPSPFSQFFDEHGCDPGLLSDCARRSIEGGRPSAVTVSQSYAMAVVGARVTLEGQIFGAAVAGYALVDFCQTAAMDALAHQLRVPFRPLWLTALNTQPISQRRLAVFGELLAVLCETVLREYDRARKLQEHAIDLERCVESRTRELATTNRVLAAQLSSRAQAEAQVRALLQRLVVAQERERQRIARDVHDHLGQLMIGLKLRLEMLHMQTSAPAAWERDVGEAQALLRRLDDDLVAFSTGLRPPLLDDFGLAPTLASFVEDWWQNDDMAVRFHDHGFEGTRLEADAEVHLFRIAQEALNNVHKHANASRVDIRLELREDTVILSIEDDGRGFDVAAPPAASRDHGMGLLGMQERAALMHGTLDIRSRVAGGTVVSVMVPRSSPRAG